MGVLVNRIFSWKHRQVEMNFGPIFFILCCLLATNYAADVTRESRAACCRYVEVKYRSVSDAFMNYRHHYGVYERKPYFVKGRPWYSKVDRRTLSGGQSTFVELGTHVISFCGAHWGIQEKGKEGTCDKTVYHPDSFKAMCVTDVNPQKEDGWKYLDPRNHQEMPASYGLVVECTN